MRIPDLLQQELEPHYVVERQIARGGMATVYLARDTKHGRLVALKVLHPEIAASVGAARFEQEITTAASLQHPHILGVFDSGKTASGFLWFTMPYVDGESLRDRLLRESCLPVDEAVRITREVAAALAVAHERGIIHRDIKPENILLTRDGSALLGDFGIARPVDRSVALTETGYSPGTPTYMSPEQAAGEAELTERTDVYGLGAVLYEMLTGEPPYVATSAQAVLAKILTTDPPRVVAQRRDVSPGLDAAVARALARSPHDRFVSVSDLARAVSGLPVRDRRTHATAWWVALGAIVVAAGVAGWMAVSRRPAVIAGPTVTAIAVLPFETEGDTSEAYLSDGLVDQIRGKLAGLPALTLIASRSSNQYRHTAKPEAQIAEELGVRYLLVGRVHWAQTPGGDRRVRVLPELVEVREGAAPAIRWQRTYDTTLADLFDLQTAVASRVAEHLGLVLSPADQSRLKTLPTTNLAAYEAWLHSRWVGIDPATLRQSLTAAERAVALDSSFAEGWANVSMIHSMLYTVTHPTPEEAAVAHQAAERAVQLAPEASAGYMARGMYGRLVSNDRAGARAAFETVLRFEPSSVEANSRLAGVDAASGDWEAALDHARRAVALDPRSPVAVRDLAHIESWMRRYSDARATTERGLALTPADLDMIQLRAICALGEGNVTDARRVLRDVPSTLDRASLVAYMASYWDLYWALDSADYALATSLRPASFDNDRGAWAYVQAELAELRHDTVRARAFADTALTIYDAAPAPSNDFQRPMFRGLLLAWLGQRQAAESLGTHGVALAEAGGDQFGPVPYAHHLMARIYTATGNARQAAAELDIILGRPYFISRDWLRVDPTLAYDRH